MGIVQTTVEEFNRAIIQKVSPLEKEKRFAIFSLFSDLIDTYLKEVKKEFPDMKFGDAPILLAEDKLQILVPKGKAQSEIDASKLCNYLLENDRKEDLLKTASFSQKALEILSDSKLLIEKFKIAKADTKASLTIQSIPADVLKTLQTS